MKLLEILELEKRIEYRIASEEASLAVFATSLLFYIEKSQEPEEIVLVTALELAKMLESVKGEDSRWFQRTSKKLRKAARQKTRSQ